MDDFEVFQGKTLSGVLRDIYVHSDNKRKQIYDIIAALKKFMTNANEAVIMAPIIKDYLDVLVKNDDSLVKVATIVQRLISATSYNTPGESDDGMLLSEQERQHLLELAQRELTDAMQRIEPTALPPMPVTGSEQTS